MGSKLTVIQHFCLNSTLQKVLKVDEKPNNCAKIPRLKVSV